MTKMTKHECRMTNEIGTRIVEDTRPDAVFSSFELRHSFGIRHSGFVIFSRLVLVLVLVLSVSCSSKRITKANVDQISEGMSKKQVESILGAPTSLRTDDFVIMKKTTYVYRQGKDTVTIIFKDDKVQSKDSTLSK